MKALLDTNILIHREAATVINEDIGVLFNWLDKLKIVKCVHPVTVEELEKHEDPKIRKSIQTKLESYTILRTKAPIADEVQTLSKKLDKNTNDFNDSLIINEVYCNRVDFLLSEDNNLRLKAALLGIADKVYTIDSFLEKATIENPQLADYEVLAVKKELFGNLDFSDDFFSSFKEDYPHFESWLNKKADEPVYVCFSEGKIIALLYLKVEGKDENYSDIEPNMPKRKRLKVGTFKVILNGFRLGERFIKIIFDNALILNVDEIYLTIFDKRIEQQRLIHLMEEYGFRLHGKKKSNGNHELVYVRSFGKIADRLNPKATYPFFSTASKIFIVPIYPQYHTELFPDSILKTESPDDFVENEPHRNAISKVYISRSIERDLNSGDVIMFYRTGGYYKGVATTIGIVENKIDNIKSVGDFISLCRKRSVFTDSELLKQWDYNRTIRPFIVNFLYSYSLPNRINMKRLIDLGVISSVEDAPRGFAQISVKNLRDILKESGSNESIAVD